MVVAQHEGITWECSPVTVAPHSPAETIIQALFESAPANQFLEIRADFLHWRSPATF